MHRVLILGCGLVSLTCWTGCPSPSANAPAGGEAASEEVALIKKELASVKQQRDDLRAILDGFEQAAIDALEGLASSEEEKEKILKRSEVGRVLEVDLAAARAGRADMVHLRSMPYVERVVASLPDVNDESLKNLLGLKRLKVLDLGGSGISDAGVAILKGISSLEDITLQRTSISDTALEHLKELPNLKRIRCAQTSVMDSGLEHLKDMPNLELLDFQDCNLVTDAGLAHLKGLKKLKNLRVWGPGITNTSLEHIASITSLKALSLADTSINDEGLSHISSLTNLQDLTLFRCLVTDAGMPALGKLSNLRRLNLRGTKVADDGMEHLKGLEKLTRLDLSESMVGNGGLEHLKSLAVEDLNLWGTRVGDAGMKHVAEMAGLKRLNLDDVGVPAENVALTDEGVKLLAGLDNLEWMHLGKTQVSDEGLDALLSLQRLNSLVLHSCPNVTDEGVARLQKARPNLAIDR